MPYLVPLEERGALRDLFGDTQETMIWSCLQGRMGDIFTVNRENPAAALALVGDFGFLGGDPQSSEAETLLEYAASLPAGRILIGEGQWPARMEKVLGERVEPITRYAIRKEPDVFDREHLQSLATVPPGFSLRQIDRELYEQCRHSDWAADFVACFGDWETYARFGLGFVALHGDTLVSGAASYTSYEGGIEIEVDTRTDFRRRGLAVACSARLILECLSRGLYPSWDAANLSSVALAEKLGYTRGKPYPCFVLK